MIDVLRPQTLGSIQSNSFDIYFRYWPVVTGSYVVPIIPGHVISLVGNHKHDTDWIIAGVLVTLVLSVLPSFALTVVVADICLGYKPGIARAYRRAFTNPGATLGTYAVTFVLFMLGMIAFVVPGMILLTRYLFICPVVVLERCFGRAARRRSADLGRGFYFRNFGVFLFAVIVVISISVGFSGMITIAVMVLDPSLMPLASLAGTIISALLGPLILLQGVLLYYDMRVRKESYGSAHLMDDIGS